MSSQLIDHSPDLKRLRDEGFNINVVDGHLLTHEVPYVTAKREVRRGVLLMPLDAANNRAEPPPQHTSLWAGEYPCRSNGTPIEEIRQGTGISSVLVGDIRTTCCFSAMPKPLDRYPNFYDKVKSYVARISGPAREIDPTATAQTYPHIPASDKASVFKYIDTASSRAEITSVTRKLEGKRVALLGLGGTGSYILDFLAKTWLAEISMWDGDVFQQHNAFRAPGAASGAELEEKLSKVEYFARVYGRMRNGIVPYPRHFCEADLNQLEGMDYVFLSMEAGHLKKLVIDRLVAKSIPFTDVGMGVYLENDHLGGTLRITSFSGTNSDHLKARIPLSDGGLKNEYDKNIQIAELNAINGAFAVIRFKKHFDIYGDSGHAHYSAYSIVRNEINNEDKE